MRGVVFEVSSVRWEEDGVKHTCKIRRALPREMRYLKVVCLRGWPDALWSRDPVWLRFHGGVGWGGRLAVQPLGKALGSFSLAGTENNGAMFYDILQGKNR